MPGQGMPISYSMRGYYCAKVEVSDNRTWGHITRIGENLVEFKSHKQFSPCTSPFICFQICVTNKNDVIFL